MFETVMFYLLLKLFSVGVASSGSTSEPPQPPVEIAPPEGAEIDPFGKPKP